MAIKKKKAGLRSDCSSAQRERERERVCGPQEKENLNVPRRSYDRNSEVGGAHQTQEVEH